MYVCMCVCMYVCVYIYVCVCLCVCHILTIQPASMTISHVLSCGAARLSPG